jgi:hypothetical protein
MRRLDRAASGGPTAFCVAVEQSAATRVSLPRYPCIPIAGFARRLQTGTLTMDKAFASATVKPPRMLVCFSHLRWDFVYQRPQHLLSRAARTYRVVYFEEPFFEERVEAHLRSAPSLAA